MDINISDLLSKSDDELYDFFKGLKRADKFDVWNEISKADIPRIKSFADYLKNIEVTKCVTKGGEKTETVITAFEQIVGPIRSRAIDQAWAKERDLVKKGLGTVNWTEAEQKIIINSRRRPNLPGRYQGHHMCNANTYPHLAGISDNIQFLSGQAQSGGSQHNRAHRGSSFNSTNYFYDTITGGRMEFDTNDISSIKKTVFALPSAVNESEESKRLLSELDAKFPGFKDLPADEKVVIQRLDAIKPDGEELTQFIIKNCPSATNVNVGNASELSKLAERAMFNVQLDSISGFPDDYADLLKRANFSSKTRMELADLTYKLKIDHVDPKTIDVDSILKNIDAKDLLPEYKSSQADDLLELILKGVKSAGIKSRSPYIAMVGSPLNPLPSFSSVSKPGFDAWLRKQTVKMVNTIRQNPQIEKLIASGLGERILNEALDAPDLIEFAVICVDIYKGLSTGTMTVDEAGKKVFDWGIVVLGSEAGAAIGAAIVPPIGPIVGGILGGTLAAIFGEFFYDDLCADAFNMWDRILSDGRHFLEGKDGNDVFNYAHGEMNQFSLVELFTQPDDTEKTFDIDTKGGNDYAAGYKNDDTLVGGTGSDFLVGCGGNDTIYGDKQQDDYKAESADISYDDILYGGSGNDTIYGGAGNDIIYGDGIKSQSEVTENDVYRKPKLGLDEKWMEWAGMFEVFNPYSSLDTSYDDTIYGGDGTDFIYGGIGNDKIYGGNDADIIYGEDGDDVIEGQEGDDFIDGGEGNNNISGGKGDDYVISGSGNDTIHTLQGDDTIVVESGTNYIVGGTGDDSISGGSGDDTIFGDRDDGVSSWQDGNDIIYGGYGNDIIHAGGYDDYIEAGAGNDVIFGDSGDNEIHCDTGNDKVYGGKDTDVIYGGEGSDTLFGGSGGDFIYGEYGVDYIYGEDGADEIYGGSGNDFLHGDSGDDYIAGEYGNDHIYGDGGYDVLDGGAGNDVLRGGDGKDTYIFDYDYGNDTVDDLSGINHIELGYKDFEALDYEWSDGKVDLIFTLYDTDGSYVLDEEGEEIINYNVKTNDVLCIKNFDQCGEDTYFWINDDSYQIIEEDGKLKLVHSDVPESSWTGGTGGRIKDDIIDDMNKKYEEAGKAQPPRDPLVIYFTESAASELIGVNNSAYNVYFDLDRNGFAEKTAWIGPNDGFLVLDRNGNGIIDDGGELFSDQVTMSNGKRSESGGFEALADVDNYQVNKKVIDKNDDIFEQLRIWIDSDTDGITDEGELHTLDEMNIESISYDFRKVEDDENAIDKELGITVTDRAIVKFKDNTEKPIAEHWFDVKSYNTQETHVANDNNSITSFGIMPSIGNALEADETGRLAELLEQFSNSDSFVEKHVLTRKILYFITGADSIASNSRGGYIDARDLHVIEKVMGVDNFIGADGGNNPNSVAGPILKSLFVEFEALYFTLINLESSGSNYLDHIVEELDENGNTVLDLTNVKQKIDDHIEFGYDMEEKICGVYAYLVLFDATYKTNYAKGFKEYYSDHIAALERYQGMNYVIGTEGNDVFNGSGDNELFWTEGGNDKINASGGNDIVYGGAGNDTIDAGAGNDIVYGEDGNDNISGGYGDDIIYAGSGDDTVNGCDGDDTIYADAGNDTINGGAGNDAVYAGEGNDIINGGDDDDMIFAESGDDTIYGGSGNDIISAGDGNDYISGGEGDDELNGGAGDDTYYIDADHGNDIIRDSEGHTTLVFADDISAEAYGFSVDINNGFLLVNEETEESIAIADFINNPLDYTFEFNGQETILGGYDEINNIEGNDEDDTITVSDGFNIIHGNNGDDTIIGGDGIDFIYGGYGNDVIDGGNGTNVIRGESGNDTITDGTSDSYLDGGKGDDIIYAGDGNDVVLGGAGNDQLYGEDGNDVIAGNDGDDVISGGNGNDTVYADAGNDNVHGNKGNDSLFGGDGDDIIYGDEGEDYLEAGNGEDELYGGAGNDVFVGGEGINNMYGEDGDDVFYGGNGVNNMYGGEGDDNFTGGELGDHIYGGTGKDVMNGGNGSNMMYGEEGNDKIYGGNDGDYIEGGEGDDYLCGGNGVNIIYGGDGNDQILSGDDGSYLNGGDGNDKLKSGGGNDVLDGGSGNDELQGDHGDDTYVYGNGYDIDTIFDSAGSNTIRIRGYEASDMNNTRELNNNLVVDFGENTGDVLIINGFFNFNSNRDFKFVFDDGVTLYQDMIEAQNAPIYGTEGNDNLYVIDNSGWKMYAGSGNDILIGGAGNDTLDGGAGNDSLNGASGNNTYIYGKGYDIDTIETLTNSDTIIVHGYSAAEMNNTRELNNDLVVDFGENTGDRLIIKGYFNYGSDRDFKFVFDDGTELVQSDIKAKTAPIIGTAGNDYLNATNENDTIDGGAGDDTLCGSNGEDTYIFGKGYAHDYINEWGNDHSFVVLKDINSDEITVADQTDSNLNIFVNDTEDVLTITNFMWGYATYTFSFADGAEGYVDKNTWKLVLTKQPETVEDIEQTFTEFLGNIYTNDVFGGDLVTDATVIADVTESINAGEESGKLADMTDIQTMILAENMSAFSNDIQVSNGINIGDITADTSSLSQLLVNSMVK